MIKVAIVDDSATARRHLRETLETDSQILVVGEAATGAEALRVVGRTNPDLVTMDVFLRGENGLDVTSSLMSSHPKPIIIITGVNPEEPRLVYEALKCGALEVLPKLPARTNPQYEASRETLLRMVKAYANVPVATRWARYRGTPAGDPAAEPVRSRTVEAKVQAAPKILLIGASTGGPPVVSALLGTLKKPFPIPIVVVQHISRGFARGFSEWLSQACGFKGVLVDGRVRVEPNTVYIAPDTENIEFSSNSHLAPVAARPTDKITPSIDVMFESAARRFGNGAVGVLLTGMGRDGAAGLKQLRDAGATTIAQDPPTCAVDSMPSSAISIGAVETVLCPDKIPVALERLLRSTADSTEGLDCLAAR